MAFTEQKHFESLYPEDSWDNVMEQIVSYIKEGASSQIVGLPGVGRSNIVGLLAYNKELRLRHFPKHHGIVHFVVVNFSEVKKRPYADVLKFIFLCIGNSLREREMREEYEKIDGFFKDALTYNDELVFTQGLKTAIDYLAIDKKLTVVFLFDRVDDYIPQLNEELFILLRSLRDRAKYRFSVVFSLSRALEDVVEPQLLSDFSDFIAGHTIYLPIMDKVSLIFRMKYLEKITGKKIDEKILDELISLTGGHIRLMKIAAESLLASQFIPADLSQFLYDQPSLQAALRSIWQSLSPEEQDDLLKHTYPQEGYLANIGLIQENELTIPLFDRAVRESLFKQSTGGFIYDETTQVIKRGDLVISDTLTKAEFRLFRFLIQHCNEIIDRETLIAAVWQDNATTLGVTEQAVDQLIFRLRRKIEEDPNNPVHLLTIKGRGVKFQQ